jgi:hypothetical protein
VSINSSAFSRASGCLSTLSVGRLRLPVALFASSPRTGTGLRAAGPGSTLYKRKGAAASDLHRSGGVYLIRARIQRVPSDSLQFFLEGVAEAALYCAHRTSTFLSCAFCEQEGHLVTPSHPSTSERRGRGAARGAQARSCMLPSS